MALHVASSLPLKEGWQDSEGVSGKLLPIPLNSQGKLNLKLMENLAKFWKIPKLHPTLYSSRSLQMYPRKGEAALVWELLPESVLLDLYLWKPVEKKKKIFCTLFGDAAWVQGVI